MDNQIGDLVALVGIVVGLGIAYGKAFGPYQTAISQAIIDAGRINSRYRPLTNLIVGVVIGVAITVVGALWLHTWEILPAGIFAGILASVEAGKVHDAEKAT
jgi:hypothetical protein